MGVKTIQLEKPCRLAVRLFVWGWLEAAADAKRLAGFPAGTRRKHRKFLSDQDGETMNRQLYILLLMAAFFCVANVMAEDRISIEKNVHELAAAIETGQDASGFAADAYTPYVFVMESGGRLLVHPTLAGEDLKEKALPIYEALVKATPEGVWVEYAWKGKEKHTFAKRMNNNLIIASGY